MMRYARTILGYHGCDALVAEEVLAGRSPLRASENAHDWLGRGIYFWVPTYRQGLAQAGEVFPENEGREPWRLLRRGDCAVIHSFLALREDEGVRHESVRGCFLEGDPSYPRSGIYTLAHFQVAVRDPTCIAGVFRPTR